MIIEECVLRLYTLMSVQPRISSAMSLYACPRAGLLEEGSVEGVVVQL